MGSIGDHVRPTLKDRLLDKNIFRIRVNLQLAYHEAEGMKECHKRIFKYVIVSDIHMKKVFISRILTTIYYTSCNLVTEFQIFCFFNHS